jgi:hypothetical protein
VDALPSMDDLAKAAESPEPAAAMDSALERRAAHEVLPVREHRLPAHEAESRAADVAAKGSPELVEEARRVARGVQDPAPARPEPPVVPAAAAADLTVLPEPAELDLTQAQPVRLEPADPAPVQALLARPEAAALAAGATQADPAEVTQADLAEVAEADSAEATPVAAVALAAVAEDGAVREPLIDNAH